MDKRFLEIKSIVSDCICKVVSFVERKIPETALNLLANEYTDQILSTLTEQVSAQMMARTFLCPHCNNPVATPKLLTAMSEEEIEQVLSDELNKGLMDDQDTAEILKRQAHALAGKIPKPQASPLGNPDLGYGGQRDCKTEPDVCGCPPNTTYCNKDGICLACHKPILGKEKERD